MPVIFKVSHTEEHVQLGSNKKYLSESIVSSADPLNGIRRSSDRVREIEGQDQGV